MACGGCGTGVGEYPHLIFSGCGPETRNGKAVTVCKWHSTHACDDPEYEYHEKIYKASCYTYEDMAKQRGYRTWADYLEARAKEQRPIPPNTWRRFPDVKGAPDPLKRIGPGGIDPKYQTIEADVIKAPIEEALGGDQAIIFLGVIGLIIYLGMR